MAITQTVELLLPKLPPAARKAYRVPSISHNLVAVSELCDAGCTVYFHKHENTKEKQSTEAGVTKPPVSGEYHSLPRVPIESP